MTGRSLAGLMGTLVDERKLRNASLGQRDHGLSPPAYVSTPNAPRATGSPAEFASVASSPQINSDPNNSDPNPGWAITAQQLVVDWVQSNSSPGTGAWGTLGGPSPASADVGLVKGKATALPVFRVESGTLLSDATSG